MTKGMIIAEAKKMFNGSNFRIENIKKTFIDDKGLIIPSLFTAVVFENLQNETKYIGVDFI